MNNLAGKKVILGISGSIAAYKSPLIARELVKRGARVVASVTEAGRKFVTDATLETVTEGTLANELFPDFAPVDTRHVDLTGSADIMLVAPASADILAKFACGIADDMLSTMYIAFDGPVLIAPAMNTRMFRHPAVRKNVEILMNRGNVFVGPDSGDLACGDFGTGRLASVEEIVFSVETALASPNPLMGKRVLVSAGGTEEPMDPVRVITNRSSGKMGIALVREAAIRGAEVTLVHGNMSVEPPPGVRTVRAVTHDLMEEAMLHEADDADVVIMAAAVSDFTVSPSEKKIPRGKTSFTMTFKPTSDILAALCRRTDGSGRIIVGFSAETVTGSSDDFNAEPDAPLTSFEKRALEKLRRKGVDIMVCNVVDPQKSVFGSDTNAVTILSGQGIVARIPEKSKEEIASAILDVISGDLK